MPVSSPTTHRHHSTTSSHSGDAYHRPHTVEDLTRKNVDTIVQLEEAAKAKRTRTDLFADAISDFCGSMTFVWVHVAWFGFWICFNSLMPRRLHFDPFPFTFLTLVVSLEAIFLSTFILISQNHQTRLSERRNHLNLQVDLLSEQENTKMLQLLERIACKLDIPNVEDPQVKVLEKATQPEKLIEQIDAAVDKTAHIQEEKHSQT
jgi:uncharacterized membrane protein